MGRPLSVLDGSVLIALLDESDVGRPAARGAVAPPRQDHDLVIPATAISESIVAPYRLGRSQGERAEAALIALASIAEVTREIASRAAQLRATRQIKLPDAIILATATKLAADQVLTFDRRWRGLDPRVHPLEP